MLRSSVSISDAGVSAELRKQPAFADTSMKRTRWFPARHSQVVEYNIYSDDAQQKIVVKREPLCDKGYRASLEFDNLVKARSMLGEELMRSVAEPLLALPDAGILVTRKLLGTSLALLLKKYGNRLCGPFFCAAVAEKTRLAGTWLKSFQEATRAEPIVFNQSCFLADVEKRLSRLEGRGFDPKLGRELLEKMSLHSARLSGRLVPAAARHGDFVPQNIIVLQDRVGIVDFEAFAERESVYYDPAMFLGHLLVLRTRAPYSPVSLDVARVAFLSGFCGKGCIDQDLFSIYYIQAVIRTITDGPPLNRGWGKRKRIRELTKSLKDLAAGSL